MPLIRPNQMENKRENTSKEESQAPDPIKGTSLLLRLPGEIRNHIYEHLLAKHIVELRYNCPKKAYCTEGGHRIAPFTASANALLRVNRQIYNEFHPLVYRKVLLNVHTDGFVLVLRDLGSQLLASIKIMSITSDTFRNFLCRRKYCVTRRGGRHYHSGYPGVLPNLEKILYIMDEGRTPYLDDSENLFERIDALFNKPTPLELLFSRVIIYIEARRTTDGALQVFSQPKKLDDFL